MGERKTVPQESKLLEPGAEAEHGYAMDLKDLRYFEPAGGADGKHRIALYAYGKAEATFWVYNTIQDRNTGLDKLYEITGWKRPNSLQPPQRG